MQIHRSGLFFRLNPSIRHYFSWNPNPRYLKNICSVVSLLMDCKCLFLILCIWSKNRGGMDKTSTYRPRRTKDSWSVLRLGSTIRTSRQEESRIRAQILGWSAICRIFEIRIRSIHSKSPQSVSSLRPKPSMRKPIHPPHPESRLRKLL